MNDQFNPEEFDLLNCMEGPTKRMVDTWKSQLQTSSGCMGDYQGFGFIHEVWTPKVKWFRPPTWKVFRWAYHIEKTLYTNCYPISMSEGEM